MPASLSSERRLDLVTEALNGFVYAWDVRRCTIERSEGFERVLGYPPDEIEVDEAWWHERLHPDDSERSDALLQQAVEMQERAAYTEYRVRHRDGRWIWLRDHMRLEYETAGALCQIVGCAIDVHDEHLAAEELKAEQEKRRSRERQLRLALEAARMGTWSIDRETGLAILGGQQAELLGLPHDRTSTSLAEFFAACHEDDSQRVREAMDDVWRDRTPFRQDFRVRAADGGLRWLGARGEVFETAYGLRMMGVSADITERRQIEDELRLKSDRLERQEERKDLFLATLGHELRNPLAALDGGLRLLQRGAQNPDDLYSMMSGHLRQLSQLVDDLLEMSRITRGKVKLRPQRVDLAEVVRQAVRTVQSLTHMKSQSLEVDLEPVTLDGDPMRLEQVVSNLLSNAAKFTPEGGHVEVELRRAGEVAELTVRDSGPGIDDHILGTIFEPFMQAPNSAEGLGIGLSLASGFVALHGGDLTAESDADGSRFTVRLPLQSTAGPPDEPAETVPPVDRSPRQDLDGLRVLVVDDLRDTADALSMLLEGDGCRVETAYDAASARRVAARFEPEAILLDLGLPDQRGDLLMPSLRRDDGTPFLVAMTGYGDATTRRRVVDAGFDLHLLKPLDYDTVLEHLRRLRGDRDDETVSRRPA